MLSLLPVQLEQGTKIELPFWMLPMFLTHRYVTVMDSRKFGVRYIAPCLATHHFLAASVRTRTTLEV